MANVKQDLGFKKVSFRESSEGLILLLLLLGIILFASIVSFAFTFGISVEYVIAKRNYLLAIGCFQVAYTYYTLIEFQFTA